jgi:hypothetical protein
MCNIGIGTINPSVKLSIQPTIKEKLMKENNIQRAVRQRDEIIKIIGDCWFEQIDGEDNSWRYRHNFLIFSLQIERKLLEYFK